MRSIIILSFVAFLLLPIITFAAEPANEVAYAIKDGSSFEKAIIIKYIGDYGKSINQEYEYLKMEFGTKGKEWELQSQSLKEENNRFYDQIDIKILSSGELKTLYFDITEPFEELNRQLSSREK